MKLSILQIDRAMRMRFNGDSPEKMQSALGIDWRTILYEIEIAETMGFAAWSNWSY